MLSDEILNHSNHAIWYTDSEQRLDDKEHLFDLEQMQPFVFPITARFLTNSRTALDVYNYAISKHIPVLPIAVESSLETLFAKACGEIQFVDITNTDITAIGYDEKLSRFLSSVLIDNETADKNSRNIRSIYLLKLSQK